MSDVLWNVCSVDVVVHAVSILVELSQKCCEVRHCGNVCLCGCVGDATENDEVQEVRAGWAPCQRLVLGWGEPGLRPLAECWGVVCSRDDTTLSRRCAQDGCPVGVPCWLARRRDSGRRPRVGSSGVAEAPMFNNVRTTIVRWRPIIGCGALVNPLQQDVLLDALLSPMLL
jgi:hypothetical protein